MPSYNAEEYIQDAIESIIQQTYKDWELIIVDDKSTDNTYNIALNYTYKDSRIKVYQLEFNSGSAHRPRLTAEKIARGQFICQIDADDYIEHNYLEKLIKRQKETNADAVICRLCHMSSTGVKLAPFNPSENFNFSSIISGKEAFIKTIGSWEINGLGIFKSIILETLSSKNSDTQMIDSINADEVYTRLKFLSCSKVAFCDADYYYRINPESITKKFSLKLFDSLDAVDKVRLLTLNEFGKSSKEYKKALSYHFLNILNSLSLFSERYDEIDVSSRLGIKNKIFYNWKKITFVDVYRLPLKSALIYMCGFHLIYIAYFCRNYVRRK